MEQDQGEKQIKDKENQNISFKCSNHPQQDVLFVCAINDWHFDLLCQTCTPAHTQNHPKRLKTNLKAFGQFHKEALNGLQEVQKNYQSKIKLIDNALNEQLVSQKAIQDLKQLQKNLHTIISKFFQKTAAQIRQKFGSFEEDELKKLTKIKNNLEQEVEQANSIKKCTTQLKVQQWKSAAKKIYFKDKSKIYMDEIEEIVKQHTQFKSQIKILSSTTEEKTFSKIEELLRHLIGIEKNLPTQKNQENSVKSSKGSTGKTSSTSTVRRPIVHQKKKTCKNCNQEMEYLTDNRKHLICKHCNNKERNYTKKIN